MPSVKPPFRFWNFFFSLKGRVSRRAIWWFVLPAEGALYGGGYALALIRPKDFYGQSFMHSPWFTGLLILSTVSVVLQWPIFFVLFKRLHDRGVSGLIALPYFLMIMGSLLPIMIIRATSGNASRFTLVTLPHYLTYAGLAFTLLLAIILAILPGTIGRNPYGPDPRFSNSATDVF